MERTRAFGAKYTRLERPHLVRLHRQATQTETCKGRASRSVIRTPREQIADRAPRVRRIPGTATGSTRYLLFPSKAIFCKLKFFSQRAPDFRAADRRGVGIFE